MKRKIYFGAIWVFVLFTAFGGYAIGQTVATKSKSLGTTGAESPTVTVKEQESRLEELEQKIEELKQDDVVEKRSLSRKIFVTCILIVVGFAFFILLKYGLKRFEEMLSEKGAIRESEQTLRLKTIVRLFHWVGSIAIIGAGLYMVLANFGVNVAPLLAGAGIVGLAFGFGGQYLIRDLINGIFILLEGHYSVNDVNKLPR